LRSKRNARVLFSYCGRNTVIRFKFQARQTSAHSFWTFSNIPSSIHISNGKPGDVNVLDILPLEPGAFYIMDSGYLNFERLYAMHQAQAFFVTRAKRVVDFE